MSQQINQILLDWYHKNKRDLPWRNTSNPYPIWLSEIILQQTRVQQGTAYFNRFLEAFPNLEDLAKAEEQQVLQLWQGLGYYSRARNLHKTAKTIVKEWGGKFPNSYQDILSLPGIGPYTAAAISSFAYNLPHAVVDGNVYRVLSRLYNVDTPIDSTKGKKKFQELADHFLNSSDPANHNQAIMEFGATLCSPTNPKCSTCPLQLNCEGYRNNTHLELPKKGKKTKVTERNLYYIYSQIDGKIALKKRTEKDIWQHLFELPQLSNKLDNSFLIHSEKHLLSHQKLNIHFYQDDRSKSELVEEPNIEWVSLNKLHNFPKPKPIESFLERVLEEVKK